MKRRITVLALGMLVASSGAVVAATASPAAAGCRVERPAAAGPEAATAATASTVARGGQLADEPAPPTINLWSPRDGLHYDTPASVLLWASVTAPSGTVERVEFYRDNALVGTVTAAPYQMRLRITVDGSYTFFAKVYDDGGRGATSASSTISVSTPPTVTVRGRVVAGVEAGCLILLAEYGQSYLLFGGDPAVVKVGAVLEVTGRLRTDVVSYCMQGRPLEVTSATPIPATGAVA